MKAVVDPETCIGCELCVSICPNVFSMNDDGKSEAITSDINADDQDEAQDATNQCPVAAISIQ